MMYAYKCRKVPHSDEYYISGYMLMRGSDADDIVNDYENFGYVVMRRHIDMKVRCPKHPGHFLNMNRSEVIQIKTECDNPTYRVLVSEVVDNV